MSDDKTVAVRLTASTDLFKKAMLDAQGFVKGLATNAQGSFARMSTGAKTEFGKTGSEGQKLGARLTSVGAGMAVVGAGLLAVGVSATSSTITLGKEVLKLQRFTGMTAEEASKLNYAAKMSGVSTDSLAVGIGRLSKNMEAGNPAFETLGVNVRDADGSLRSVGDILPDIAEKVSVMTNGAEKSALMLQLFGRSGMDLLPFLNKGRDGIKELSDEASKMGLVLSQDNVAAVAENIRAQRQLNAAFEGVKVQIGNTMMPILTAFERIWASIPGPIKDVIGPLVVFGGLGLGAAGAISMLIGQLKNLGPALSAMATWVTTASPATLILTGLAVATGVAMAMVAAFGDTQRASAQDTAGFTSALEAQGEEQDATTAKTIAARIEKDKLNGVIDKAQVGFNNLGAAVKEGGAALGEYVNYIDSSTVNWARAKELQDGLSDSTSAYVQEVLDAVAAGRISGDEGADLLQTTADLAAAYDDAASSQSDQAQITEAMAPKVSTLAEAEQAAADATENHADAAKNLNDLLHGLLDPMFAAVTASNRLADAQKAEADAQLGVFYATQNLADLRANHADDAAAIALAERDLAAANDQLRDAQVGSGQAAIDFEASLNTLSGQMRDDPTVYQQNIDKINAMEASHEISAATAQYFRDRVAELATQIGLIPPSAYSKITVDTAEAMARVTELTNKILNIPGTPTQAEQNYAGGFGKKPGERASGGPVSAGEPYRVAEQGIELYRSASGEWGLLRGPFFTPGESGQIFSAAASASMMRAGTGPAGGGGASVQLTLSAPNYVGSQAELFRTFERMLASNPGLVASAVRGSARSSG